MTILSLFSFVISLGLCTAIEGRGPAAAQKCAGDTARGFGEILSLDRPLAIKLVSETNHPKNAPADTWAWANRDPKVEGGCLLTFTPESITRPSTIAHEVCHCRYDYDLMTVDGAVMPAARRKLAEDRAGACADFLTLEDQELERMRREKEIPDWGEVLKMAGVR